MEKSKRIQIHPCIVKGCPGKNSDDIMLYSIPEKDKSAWCLNLQIRTSDVKTNTRVCSRHFEKEWIGLTKLKAGARPTLNIGRLNIRALSYDASKPRFNPRKCSIQGCNVTSPPDKVYKFPADPERYEKWLSICPLKTSAKENKHKYICGKHFDPSVIFDFRLKSDAVPLASLCYNMQPSDPPRRRNTNFRRKRNVTAKPKANDTVTIDDESDTYSSDGLECQNCCNACQNNSEEYIKKYFEMEQRLKESEARHLIETLALQNQIEELTVELDKARQYHGKPAES